MNLKAQLRLNWCFTHRHLLISIEMMEFQWRTGWSLLTKKSVYWLCTVLLQGVLDITFRPSLLGTNKWPKYVFVVFDTKRFYFG